MNMHLDCDDGIPTKIVAIHTEFRFRCLGEESVAL